MTKENFLEILTQKPCKEGLDVFLAFEGGVEEYFIHHERGGDALWWCIEKLRKGANLTLPNVQAVGWVSLKEGATLHLPKEAVIKKLTLDQGAKIVRL